MTEKKTETDITPPAAPSQESNHNDSSESTVAPGFLKRAASRIGDIWGRTKKYFNAVMGEHRFFPRFLAVRGSLFMLTAAVLLTPVVVLSGLTMTAFALATTAISLCAFGVIGAVNFIPDVAGRLHEAFRVHVQGKEPRAPKPKNKPMVSLWKRIGQNKLWKKFQNTGFAKYIAKTRAFKIVKSSPIWEKISYLSRDQEVALRSYATTGSVGMVVATTAVVLTNAIALPAVLLPAAALMAAGAVATGIVATYHNVKNLFISGKSALKDGHAKKMAKKAVDAVTDPLPIPGQKNTVSPNSPKKEFSETSAKPATNDNNNTPKPDTRKKAKPAKSANKKPQA